MHLNQIGVASEYLYKGHGCCSVCYSSRRKKITQTPKTCTNHSSATGRSFSTRRGKTLQLDGRLAIAIKNFIYNTYATVDMCYNCDCARRKKEGVELE